VPVNIGGRLTLENQLWILIILLVENVVRGQKRKSPLGASWDVSLSYWFLYLFKSLSVITNQVQPKISPLKVTTTSKPV